MYVEDRLLKQIIKNIRDPNLNANILADKLEVDRTTLYRKTKEVFEVSTKKLINHVRLYYILKNTHDERESIYKFAVQFGIKNKMTFYHMTKRRFGKTPGEIQYDIVHRKDREEYYNKYLNKLRTIKNLIF